MEKRGEKLRSRRKIYLGITILLEISLILAVIQAITTNNYLVVFTSLAVSVLFILPYLLNWKYNLKIPAEIELISVLFIYSTLFLGEVHSFYVKYWWWDIFLHTGSAIVFGFIGFGILYLLSSRHNIVRRPWLIALFSFSFAIAIGAIWEIFEFSMDQLLGWNMQKSGLVDTMSDLIVDTIGALFASTIGYFYLKRKKTFVFNDLLKEFSERRKR